MDKKENFTDYLLEIPNYLSLFAIPIYLYTAGPMLIEMSKNLGINLGNLNLIFTFFTIGSVIGQLTSILYNKKLRSVLIIISFYVLIIFALIPLLFNKDLYIFYLLYFVIGYSAGVILIQATKYILESSISNKERLTTILLFFYPAGSIIAPFIASTLIKNNYNWRFSYYIMIIISVINIVLYFFLKFRYKGNRTVEEEPKIALKNVFFDKKVNILFITGCALLFFYCVSETVMATWIPTFLRNERSMDIYFAGFSVSLFWIGILAGRLLISIIAGKLKTNYIILFLSIFAFIALIFFTIFKSKYIILIIAAISGLGFSGIGPLGISATGTLYKKGRGVLISIIFAFNYLGIALTPLLTKSVSNVSMVMSVAVSPVFMLLVVISIIVKIFLEKRFENRKGF